MLISSSKIKRINRVIYSILFFVSLLPLLYILIEQNSTPAIAANASQNYSQAWGSLEHNDTSSVDWGDWDGDGDLDFAVGNRNQQNQIYLNETDMTKLAWSTPETDNTFSIAWGDWDGDGDLDLAVGNWGQSNRVYQNDRGIFSLKWSSTEMDNTRSIAWGDWDNNGTLDLAVGNFDQPNRIYKNTGGNFTHVWSSSETSNTTSVAWGDWDNDGDSDLAVGNWNEANQIYSNDNSMFNLAWLSPQIDNTNAIDWADWNLDGFVDLAVGNWGKNRVYENTNGNLILGWTDTDSTQTNSIEWSKMPVPDLLVGNENQRVQILNNDVAQLDLYWESDEIGSGIASWGDWDGDNDLDVLAESTDHNLIIFANSHNNVAELTVAWSTAENDDTRSHAWGDWDNDGDLDLAAGNDENTEIYSNIDGQLKRVWVSSEIISNTQSLDWGDWDNDGDIDLAIGTSKNNFVYENVGGGLVEVWRSGVQEETRAVDWGDWDNDGDLDLAVGNNGPNRVYFNSGGKFSEEESWATGATDDTRSIAWGDWNGDGYLDLAVGNNGRDRIYTNPGTGIKLNKTWDSVHKDFTYDIAWGDWDGDGDLDLAVGSAGNNRIYTNNDDTFVESWTSTETDDTRSIAWGDWDGDGDLDLAVGNAGGDPKQKNRIYTNLNGKLSLAWSSENNDFTQNVAWGDLDGDGDLDLIVGNKYGPNRFYRNSKDDLTFAWIASEIENTRSVAWGDWDGDGDLDLAVGNEDVNRVFSNQNGTLINVWESLETDDTRVVAWGDMDDDGDLDLAVGNVGVDRIYENLNGTLSEIWSSEHYDNTHSVAWGDWDNDGDLDLATGALGHSNRVYENLDSTFNEVWASPDEYSAHLTRSIAWGDWDNDGDLDLAVGNSSDQSRIYNNENGTLIEAWQSSATAAYITTSIAWGDWDNDGDLDLAVGNRHGRNLVYVNSGGDLSLAWVSPEISDTQTISWGDMDDDGDLDLAVGNRNGNDQIYINSGEDLILGWISPDIDSTRSVAWGDWDNDGDLDLAAGYADYNRVYENSGDFFALSWNAPEVYQTRSIAWGDIDGDNDLDLAVGNWNGPIQLYINDQESLTLTWASTTNYKTQSIVWGDWDSDGDLDLAVGNDGINQIYVNNKGVFSLGWNSPEGDNTQSLAWGDWDSDGDLDLAVGNNGFDRLYVNSGNNLFSSWVSEASEDTQSLAWGDWDGDSDLDLAVGIFDGKNYVYNNDGGTLIKAWSSIEEDKTQSVIWGDWNGDNILDLVVGNDGNNRLYMYSEDEKSLTLYFTFSHLDNTRDLAFGDLDNDGDLDLVVGNTEYNRVYFNNSISLKESWVSPEMDDTFSIALGDWDNDGDDDFASGSSGNSIRIYKSNIVKNNDSNIGSGIPKVVIQSLHEESNNQNSTSIIYEGPTIPINYLVYSSASRELRKIKAYYSLNGGGTWREAIPTSDTQTENLLGNPSGSQHTFNWDLYKSNVFGSSDNVLFRIDGYEDFQSSGVYQHEYNSSYTFPFRIRGNQIRVIDEQNSPKSNAMVFRQLAGSPYYFVPYLDNFEIPFETNPSGYLQGRGELQVGDSLVAMAPINSTNNYTIYRTSAAVTTTSLDAFEVKSLGVQTLTVSGDNPLIVYDLDVSLEWDASKDLSYLNQLENDIKRASQMLFDLSNGQVALGKVTIYQNKENWNNAHIIISASNNLRPSAILGGNVLIPEDDEDKDEDLIPNAFLPGQVRMPPTWNRFGEPNGTLGEDWPRVLAHELGHYLLRLSDNYVGLTEDNLLTLIDCQGSAMTNPYVDAYSEFLTRDQWNQNGCLNTLAERHLGRSDWETITKFYPMLKGNNGNINAGPSNLPLALTQVSFEPVAPTQVLLAPFFNVTDSGGNPAPLSTGQGEGFLFKTNGNSDPTDDRVVHLGTVIGDLIHARGAEVGDRLCVYDYSQAPRRLGCDNQIGAQPGAIALHPLSDWSPEIAVTPVTTRSFMVTATQISGAGNNVYIQLLPTFGAASDELGMTQLSANTYGQTITLPDPAFAGYVRVWVAGTSQPREHIVEFMNVTEWGGRAMAWGGRAMAWGGRAMAWGGRAMAWGAPVLSNDGQVSIFALDDVYGDTPDYTLQALASPPSLPPWLSLVGRAYQVSSSEAIENNGMLFHYMGREVPAGYENDLQIYYLAPNTSDWQRLSTELDTYHNHASAMMPGIGVYALVATIEMPPFTKGWNSFGYPVPGSRPVATALASIEEAYTSVYHFDDSQSPAWTLYDRIVLRQQPQLSAYLNDLTTLEFGHAYWIATTKPVTLYLGVPDSNQRAKVTYSQAAEGLQLPPATYYGYLKETDLFHPQAGMVVTAWIDGQLCGETVVETYQNKLVYKIHVLSEMLWGETNECGEVGKVVSFQVDDETMPVSSIWDNSRTHYLSFPSPNFDIFLPIIMK